MVERVLTALRQGVGVLSVGIKSGGMLNGRTDFQGLVVHGRFAPLEWNAVDRGFFEAAGLEFLVGDLPAPGRNGAVVTEGMALEYFDGDSPVGVVLNPGRAVPVVGVVRDVRTLGLSVAPRPVVYEVAAWSSRQSATFTYVVRMAEGAPRLGDWARILRPIDPMAVVLNDDTVGERLARSVRDRTFAALVVGLFATASVLVTALGLAGVVAYTVVRRTREIAVRLTLGATRPSVSWLVARDALSAGVCGAAAGFIASVWLSGTLESLLYGVQAADPATLALAAASLLGIVIVAAVVPGIRTGRIAPAATLRSE
jgi:hypothetical protein